MALITAKELAARLGLTEETIVNQARKGTLPGVKPKGFKMWYFDEESIGKFFCTKVIRANNKNKKEK